MTFLDQNSVHLYPAPEAIQLLHGVLYMYNEQRQTFVVVEGLAVFLARH